MKVRLNGADADLAATKSTQWTWLGAVSNYVFVYDADAKRSLVLPTNNILRIEPVPRRIEPASTVGAADRPVPVD
ncbi:MAG: hypothetical protein QM741_13640 [Rudaea sp.]|uniref:hypothetical protein n=1 Tax=Rudaea sp. TaxID=2136325 RepID=UPI0039E5740C